MAPKRSKVEVKGLEARHYDFFLNFLSLGMYARFLHRAIRDMNIRPGERILDLGCGTGRNDELMAAYLDGRGEIVGLDIDDDMLAQAERRALANPLLRFEKRRIEQPLPFESEFDRVLIAFVLHGFEHADRKKIIRNAARALKPGGIFMILDYNEFAIEETVLPFRLFFKYGECELASEFIRHDWKQELRGFRFVQFDKHLYFSGKIQLLKAWKESVSTLDS